MNPRSEKVDNSMAKYNIIGQISILAAMGYLTDVDKNLMSEKGYSIVTGNVGTMNAEKVFVAIKTATKREGIIINTYREVYALFYACLEVFTG